MSSPYCKNDAAFLVVTKMHCTERYQAAEMCNVECIAQELLKHLKTAKSG